MATTRNIGRILVEKACELEPQYTPDHFNDVGEALDIVLSHMGEATSVDTKCFTIITTNATLSFNAVSASRLEQLTSYLLDETDATSLEEALNTFNISWATRTEEERLSYLSYFALLFKGFTACPTITVGSNTNQLIQIVATDNGWHILYNYYDFTAQTSPIVDFTAEAIKDTTVSIDIYALKQ